MTYDLVWDNPKLPGDSGDIPISKWSGWRFDSCYEIISVRDGENQLGRQEAKNPPTAR